MSVRMHIEQHSTYEGGIFADMPGWVRKAIVGEWYRRALVHPITLSVIVVLAIALHTLLPLGLVLRFILFIPSYTLLFHLTSAQTRQWYLEQALKKGAVLTASPVTPSDALAQKRD